MFYTTKMADTKHDKLGRFFFSSLPNKFLIVQSILRLFHPDFTKFIYHSNK